MTIVIQLITRLYAILVRLYPRSFRAEFEEEMQVVLGCGLGCRQAGRVIAGGSAPAGTAGLAESLAGRALAQSQKQKRGGERE